MDAKYNENAERNDKLTRTGQINTVKLSFPVYFMLQLLTRPTCQQVFIYMMILLHALRNKKLHRFHPALMPWIIFRRQNVLKIPGQAKLKPHEK